MRNWTSITGVQDGRLLQSVPGQHTEKIRGEILDIDNTHRNTCEIIGSDLALLRERLVIRPIHDAGG